MNLRDRLTPQPEQEEAYIKFLLGDWWAEFESFCNKRELANRLGNIVNLSYKIMKDNIEEDIVQKEIISKWVQDMKDLFLDDEWWVC